jgi:hypothetical protein
MPVSKKKAMTSGAKIVTRREMATIVDSHARRVGTGFYLTVEGR